MDSFTRFTAIAAPLDAANVDTDQIIPARYLRQPRGDGYVGLLFHSVRRTADGALDPGFILNQDIYKNAGIIVADRNFGCGSARENAVWTLTDNGFRSVIAPSFGDIHYNNQMNGGMVPVILPDNVCADLRAQLHANPGAEITVDLEANRVTGPDGAAYDFTIPEFNRHRLLRGLDDIAMTLELDAEIAAFESRRRAQEGWLFR